MALTIDDEATADLVGELARLRGISTAAAVNLAVRAELTRSGNLGPLRDRLAKLWAEHPLPVPTGHVADKAFFDDLSGEPRWFLPTRRH